MLMRYTDKGDRMTVGVVCCRLKVDGELLINTSIGQYIHLVGAEESIELIYSSLSSGIRVDIDNVKNISYEVFDDFVSYSNKFSEITRQGNLDARKRCEIMSVLDIGGDEGSVLYSSSGREKKNERG